jgi:hypothetical protein
MPVHTIAEYAPDFAEGRYRLTSDATEARV